MAIGGKLLGRVVSGPANAVAGKAAMEQAAGSAHYDNVTAQHLARMQRSKYHPVSVLSRVWSTSGSIQMRFAKYGMWASVLAFLLPAAQKSLAKGKFDSLDEYQELKAEAGKEPEKGGLANIWRFVSRKPHSLLAGLENIPQSLTFNKIQAGVQAKDGNLAKGVWAALQDVMSQSTAESKQLRALKLEEEEKKKEKAGVPEEPSQGRWERVMDFSGNARRAVDGLKDTSLLEGVVKVGQVAGTAVSTYDTVTGAFKNLKMLQLLQQQTTGQKMGKVRLLFSRNLPEVVKQARSQYIRSYSLASAVDLLSFGITTYVAKNKMGEFNVMNPQTWIIGVGHILNNFVAPRVKSGAVILTGLRQLNYEAPSVQDYATKVALLHPGIRQAGLSPDHAILQGLGEHLEKSKTPLSAVPGLIQSGWVDAAVKEIAHNGVKNASAQGASAAQQQQQMQPQSYLPQAAAGFVARESARGGGRPPQQGSYREAVRSGQSQQAGELVGAGRAS